MHLDIILSKLLDLGQKMFFLSRIPRKSHYHLRRKIPLMNPKNLTAWIPEGFTFSGLKVYDDLPEPMLTALYENNSTGCVIIITVNIHQEPKASIHEKDENDVEVYQINGIDHYIMNNNDQITAVWFINELECSITGGVSEDDLKTMIKSIYGSE